MTSASEYESDADNRRDRERSRSGEKERSEQLLAPRNYIASSRFNSNTTTTTTSPTAMSIVLSASTSAASPTPTPSVVLASPPHPLTIVPPLTPQKPSVVAFTIQNKARAFHLVTALLFLLFSSLPLTRCHSILDNVYARSPSVWYSWLAVGFVAQSDSFSVEASATSYSGTRFYLVSTQ